MRGMNLGKMLIIFLFTAWVYTLVLLPPAALLRYSILPLFSKKFGSFVLGVLLVHLDAWILLLSAVFIPGLFWRALNLRYSGSHEFDASNRDVRNWLLTQMIYTPTAVTLDFFHLYPLKTVHLQLFGAKLGKNVVAAGLVLDACQLKAGDGVNIGGFSSILGHALERGKISFNKVIIGRNCGIGAGAMVLPGARLEEDAFLGAQSLLTKNVHVGRHETFGGVPAKRLSRP